MGGEMRERKPDFELLSRISVHHAMQLLSGYLQAYMWS